MITLVHLHGVEVFNPHLALSLFHAIGLDAHAGWYTIVTVTPLEEYIGVDQSHYAATHKLARLN